VAAVRTLAPGIAFGDLEWVGRSGIISAVLLHGPAGVALVDPGPASCLPELERALAARGLRASDVDAVLLTHIHLDHGGVTGHLVRQRPSLRVYVHQRGAPHLIDPSRLLKSAARLYGDQMQRLWGDVIPVPSSNITEVTDGDRLDVVGRSIDVAYTPGHASHHVCFFDRDSGIAFVGDTGGIRRGPGLSVLPPTPPPDIDLDLWRASLARIRAWHPSTLFVAHCGPFDDVRAHLAELERQLEDHAAHVRETLALDATDEERMSLFTERLHQRQRQLMPEAEAERIRQASPSAIDWLGLARYWRRR
jgi:glyoxylase-like metal-dependent hydrolase (beta-lactamase superfamily II)